MRNTQAATMSVVVPVVYHGDLITANGIKL